MSTEIDSWEIEPNAKKETCTTLDEPLVLPLEKNGRAIDYYFVFDTDENKPRNMVFDCGCGGRSTVYDYMYARADSVHRIEDMATATGGKEASNGSVRVGSRAWRASGLVCRRREVRSCVSVLCRWCG